MPLPRVPRLASRINLFILAPLAISTGTVKLAQMSKEMELFRAVGLTDGLTILFGVVQLVAGLMLLNQRTRAIGAGLLLPTFVFATYALFVSNIVPFALTSILFIVMAAIATLPATLPAFSPAASPGDRS